MKLFAVVLVVIAILLVGYFYIIYERPETDEEKALRIDCTKYATISVKDKAWCQSKGKGPKIKNFLQPVLSAHQIYID